MNDNITAHSSLEYDDEILKTIPFYNLFNQSIVDLIKSTDKPVHNWLDTGCGTGNFYINANEEFPDTIFTLADPSNKMLETANKKIKRNKNVVFVLSDSQSLAFEDNTFDVITAIQCHHYLDKATRIKATENCFRMLKSGGFFITFENIAPLSETGLQVNLKRWAGYQITNGKTSIEAENHIQRYGKNYFPISIIEHIHLLNEIGFCGVEILWASYMQTGFFAVK